MFLKKDENFKRIYISSQKMVNGVCRLKSFEKDERYMCKQVQQCVTDAVKQVCICDGAQRVHSPRKGESTGAEQVRQDVTEEVMLS